jgi:hypothetical protein
MAVDNVDGNLVVVNIVLAYAYRDPAFAFYSLYEFFCCVVVMLLRGRGADSEPKRGSTSAGRAANKSFTIDAKCPLSATHQLRLLSKHLVPSLYPVPPPYPHASKRNVKPAAWAAAAHAFARYALVLWQPWDMNTHLPPGGLNWARFVAFVDECRNPAATGVGKFIGSVRLRWMMTAAEFLKAPAPIRSAIQSRRRRVADQWADKAAMADENLINRGL